MGCLYICKLGDIGMVTINSNYAASFAANAAKQTQSDLNSAMEKLSTGKRINFAKDDAAGVAIAMRLDAEVSGLAVASRNASDGQALIDTADGALKETHNALIRMRELAVQAQNGTLQASDKTALGLEFDALEAEITRISANTTWAGTKILDGTYGTTGISFRVGTSENITHKIADMTATGLSLAASAVTVDASATIGALDTAIAKVSEERAGLGAISNRLDSTVTNLDQIRVNLTASKGRIEDADFAQETGNLAKGQILQQAATAMLAQANASKQNVLALIR
jgi:flagellin